MRIATILFGAAASLAPFANALPTQEMTGPEIVARAEPQDMNGGWCVGNTPSFADFGSYVWTISTRTDTKGTDEICNALRNARDIRGNICSWPMLGSGNIDECQADINDPQVKTWTVKLYKDCLPVMVKGIAAEGTGASGFECNLVV